MKQITHSIKQLNGASAIFTFPIDQVKNFLESQGFEIVEKGYTDFEKVYHNELVPILKVEFYAQKGETIETIQSAFSNIINNSSNPAWLLSYLLNISNSLN